VNGPNASESSKEQLKQLLAHKSPEELLATLEGIRKELEFKRAYESSLVVAKAISGKNAAHNGRKE
jgi:hypothetical protein